MSPVFLTVPSQDLQESAGFASLIRPEQNLPTDRCLDMH